MGDELRRGPVEVAGIAAGQLVRRKPLGGECRRVQEHLELDVERAGCLVGAVVEVGQQRGIVRRPLSLRRAERCQGLRRDHPRRDAGAEALAEERTERLILPGLDVARRPVVQQAEAGDVLRRLGDGDGRAERVARADPDPELELVVEIAAWTEGRDRFARRLALAVGTAHGRTRRADRGGAAVIADRNMLVVRHQRIVGPEQLAGIGGVVDAGEEIRVVADRRRELEAAIGGRVEEAGAQALATRALLALGIEQVAHALAQRARAAPPSASSGPSVVPDAACAASRARPSNRSSSSAAARSNISSPIATPPRPPPPGGANTPSGRFWIGKSGAPARRRPSFGAPARGYGRSWKL